MTTSNEHNNAPAPAQEVTTPYHRDIWGISHAMADLYYDDWVLLVRAYQTLDASIARMQEQATAQAVPQGWRITKLDGADAYVINGPFGGCVAVKDADIARVIPEAILYELAAALAATPAPAPAQEAARPQNCGTSYCSCIECVCEPAQGEPFGHFRAEPFGWTDCAATDDGAIALYEHPMTNPWRDAVIEQLESWHIYVPAIHDNSPRLAIKALVNMECKAALDPAVSSEAAALAAQGVQAPAPAQLTDEERADMACAVAAICTGASSRTVAATAIEWTERALRAKGGK